MSNLKDKDFLYSFSINKEVEKEVEEEREEGGETVIVKKKVKSKVPVSLYIKNPSRSERDEADMFYAASFGRAVEAGVLPRALLDKKFKDAGGELSKKQKEDFEKLVEDLVEHENDIIRLSGDKEENAGKINDLNKKVILIRKRLVDFQTYQNILYKDTADTKAEHKTILWLLLKLIYRKDHDSDKIIPMFSGEDYEEKIGEYDTVMDSEGEAVVAGIGKMLSLVTLLYMGLAKEKSDFEYYSKQLDEDKSLYD